MLIDIYLNKSAMILTSKLRVLIYTVKLIFWGPCQKMPFNYRILIWKHYGIRALRSGRYTCTPHLSTAC